MPELASKKREDLKPAIVDPEVAAFRAELEMSCERDLPCEKQLVLDVGFNYLDYQAAFNTLEAWRRTGQRQYVAIVNPHSVLLCHRDLDMRTAVARAGLALPDGVGIVLAARILGHRHNGRVTKPTLMLNVCDWGRRLGYRHFFYGGAEGIAAQLADRLGGLYPSLEIAGAYCPPFRQLSDEEDAAIVAQINASRPDVLWVGLGAPKQEKWMGAHLGRIAAPTMVGAGAAFDFHSGSTKWAPAWVRTLGIEWMYRLAQEPRRMWRRNLDSPLFLIRVLRQRMRQT